MRHLKQLYFAILNRTKTLNNIKEELENEVLIELRLDIEQLIQLVAKELDMEYDQEPIDPIKDKTTRDITNSFWEQNDDD